MKAEILFREIAEMAQSIGKPIILTWRPHQAKGVEWIVSVDYEQTVVDDISEVMPAIYDVIEKKAANQISTYEKEQGTFSRKITEQRDVLSFMEARKAAHPLPAD